MNVNDKPATLLLQDNVWNKYTQFSLHTIMIETQWWKFCNIPKTEMLRSMIKYITHLQLHSSPTGKGKGKLHPRTCPEGEKRYSSTLSLTLALDEGG
jgi:hypothetical protein